MGYGEKNGICSVIVFLTRFSQIVGDGDCGETCAAGSKAILRALDDGLGKDGDLVGVLREVTETIDGLSLPYTPLSSDTDAYIPDTCGGTLGAIYSIFLAALTAEVRLLGVEGREVNMGMWGEAAGRAIETLGHSTKARVGHRTVMDALIPFAEGLSSAKSTSVSETEILREAISRCVLAVRVRKIWWRNWDGRHMLVRRSRRAVFLLTLVR